jgi:hypothetical protein
MARFEDGHALHKLFELEFAMLQNFVVCIDLRNLGSEYEVWRCPLKPIADPLLERRRRMMMKVGNYKTNSLKLFECRLLGENDAPIFSCSRRLGMGFCFLG